MPITPHQRTTERDRSRNLLSMLNILQGHIAGFPIPLKLDNISENADYLILKLALIQCFLTIEAVFYRYVNYDYVIKNYLSPTREYSPRQLAEELLRRHDIDNNEFKILTHYFSLRNVYAHRYVLILDIQDLVQSRAYIDLLMRLLGGTHSPDTKQPTILWAQETTASSTATVSASSSTAA